MKTIQLATHSFAAVFPALVQLWPLREGAWTQRRVAALRRVLAKAQRVKAASAPTLRLSLGLSRARLISAGRAVLGRSTAVGHNGAVTSTPYRFTDYYVGLPSTPMNPGQKGKSKAKGLNAAALKLRPGLELDIALEGHPTRAVLNTVRRIDLRGSANWIKADLSINVEKVPLLLEQETKCSCRYCGTKPKSDEVECRKCGAPLPDC